MNEEHETARPAEGRPEQGAGQPSEEDLRRQIEEQIRKARVQDLLLESMVSVLNLSARRIAKEDERDLEQARIGIEAVRATVGLLDPEPGRQVRSALSEVQMLYAREAGGAGAEAEREPQQPAPEGQGRGPSRLWTPPGTD